MHAFFFFQAEDGIRDGTVTGVQTCALPISPLGRITGYAAQRSRSIAADVRAWLGFTEMPEPSAGHPNIGPPASRPVPQDRSEERRVGKECRSRWRPHH